MISFFRRMFSSKLGVIFAIAFVGFIGLAFALTDVSTMGGFGGGAPAASTVASIDGEEISGDEIALRMNRMLDQARAQDPALDMAAIIEAGALDEAVDQYISEAALVEFGRDQGMAVSKRLIDGVIASVPAFQGFTGQFDEATFRGVLQQQGLSEAQVRDELTRQSFLQMLVGPAAAAAQITAQLAAPYAALLLEERSGQVALIPSRAMPAGDPPTAAEIGRFYQNNLARYTLPERRAVRYALFSREQAAATPPTEQQISDYYRANAADYGGRETRSLRQVILPSEADATALHAEVSGGKDFAQAARERGFNEASTIVGEPTQSEFAAQTSEEIAQAAFAAPQDGLVRPMRSGLGWHVVRVAAIERSAARPLDSVRGEIATALTASAAESAMSELYSGIEQALDEGASFEEVARARRLNAVTTPLLAADGQVLGASDFQPGPELPAILATAFTMDEDEEPLVQELVPGERYAIVDVTEIARSAPVPLPRIRRQVAGDFLLERAAARARTLAERIVARVEGGTPIAEAVRAASANLPPPQRASASRAAISQPGATVAPPLRLMFRMAADTAKLMRLPGNEGWYVVLLETIESNADEVTPELIAGTRAEFAQVTAGEYAEQFTNAIVAGYTIERDAEALAALAARLTGVAR